MTEEDAFVQAILQDPADDSPRLIYADWLEERDDPLGPLLRAHPDLPRFLATIISSRDIHVSLGELDERAKRGEGGFLQGVALAVRRVPQGRLRKPRFLNLQQSVLDRVVHGLAQVPGPGNIEVVLQLALTQRNAATRHGYLPAALAAHQRPRDLVALIGRYKDDDRFVDLLACLVQEMVLRGAKLTKEPAIRGFVNRLRTNGHPLAGLLLFLTRVEVDLADWLPIYTGSGTVRTIPFGPGRDLPNALPVRGGTRPPPVRETTDAGLADLLRSVVAHWQTESNGNVEARIFEVERPLDGNDLSIPLLRSLGLECLEQTRPSEVRAARVTPHEAVGGLFGAASAGGAYCRHASAGHARLMLWRSLQGFVGEPEETRVEELAALVEQCSWLCFEAHSAWFYRVAWDFGLLALRPDGKSLAVLAATDTD